MPTKEDFDSLSPADFMDQVEAENARWRNWQGPLDPNETERQWRDVLARSCLYVPDVAG